jgi:hypothetical protein
VTEQRKAQRFEIQLPVEVLRAGSEHLHQSGKTRNISSSGVLFLSGREIEVGGPIEYVVTLTTESGATVHLRCMGKVMRLSRIESAPEEEAFAVAVTLERYEFMRPNGHSPAAR